MDIVVIVIVVAALVVMLALIVRVLQKTVRWLTSRPTTRPTQPARRPSSTPPAYGHLPTPADPVGSLGSLSPDANLSSRSMSESDLLGE